MIQQIKILLFLLLLTSCSPKENSDYMILSDYHLFNLNAYPLSDNEELNNYLLGFENDLHLKFSNPHSSLFGGDYYVGSVYVKEEEKEIGNFYIEYKDSEIKSTTFQKGGDINNSPRIRGFEITNCFMLDSLFRMKPKEVIVTFKNAATGKIGNGEDFENLIIDLASKKVKE